MESKFFALKLIPGRPSFAHDMTSEERSVMEQHVAYWSNLLQQGIAIVYGPVLDPKGTYGLGIIKVDDETRVADITSKDPASAINKYEVHPMLARM